MEQIHVSLNQERPDQEKDSIMSLNYDMGLLCIQGPGFTVENMIR